MKKKSCIHCKHAVGNGGNAHKKGHCPAPRGTRAGHKGNVERRLSGNGGVTTIGSDVPQRGAPIAGVGGGKAASHRAGD